MLQDLYKHLLAADGDCPVAVQRGALRWALANGSDAILVMLAAYPAADAAVLDEIRCYEGAKVRAAYLSRHDRPAAELRAAVAAEKRVTVLAAIAESTEASPALLDVLSADPRRGVAVAVAANPASSTTARSAAIRHLAPNYDALSRAQQMVVRKALAVCVELHDELLATCGRELREVLSTSGFLSTESQLWCIENMLTPAAEAAAVASAGKTQPSYMWTPVARACAAMAMSVVDPVVFEALRVVVARVPVGVSGYKEMQTSAARFGAGPLDEGLRLERTADRTRDCAELIALASKSASTDGAAGRQLASRLLDNPVLPAEAARIIAAVLDEKGCRTLIGRFPDVDVATAACRRFPTLLTKEVLASVADLTPVVEAVARVVAASASRPGAERRVLEFTADVPSVLDILPAHMIVRVTPWSQPVAAGLRERLAGLGDEPERWTMFNSLAVDFDGSVADLVTLCSHLS